MAAKAFFDELEGRVDSAKIVGIDHSYVFDVEGEGRWLVEVHDGKLTVTEGWTGGADVTIRTSAETFGKLAAGKQNPTLAYMTGKIKLEGDLGAAMKLQKFF